MKKLFSLLLAMSICISCLTAGASADAALTVTHLGFQSNVTVTVTVNDASIITAIVVDSSGETPGFGTRCGQDDAFLRQFIGKKLPLTESVNTLSGATVTSTAIIDALMHVEIAVPSPVKQPAESTDASSDESESEAISSGAITVFGTAVG